MRRSLYALVPGAIVLAGVLAAPAALAKGPGPDGPGGSPIYDSTVNPLPGNLPSQAFEATSTDQYGDQVSFAGTARALNSVTVTMSSWGCQSGNWSADDCMSTPGSTFSWPITLNIYSVGANNAVGSLLGTVSQTFAIPYRPSKDDVHCTGGEWYDGAQGCFNGLADNITFDFSSQHLLLPNSVIWGIAFNTSDYGNPPAGTGTACHATTQGCGYDSLNVAVSSAVTVGSRPQPNSDYLSSTYGGFYCDDGNGGTGTFRYDSADTSSPPGQCQGSTPAQWFGGYSPAAQFNASPSGNVTCNDGLTYSLSNTVIDGNLVVPEGGTCSIRDVTVTHDLQVQEGGALSMLDSTVNHDVHADKPAWMDMGQASFIGHDLSIQGTTSVPPQSLFGPLTPVNDLCNTTIGHDLNVEHSASAAPYLIGDTHSPSGICGFSLSVGNNVNLHDNAGNIDFSDNNPSQGPSTDSGDPGGTGGVGHDLHVEDNTGAMTIVENNTIGHDASCHANTNPMTDQGTLTTNTAGHNNTCG